MIPEKRIIRRIQSGGCAIHCQDCSISQLCIPFTLNEHELDQWICPYISRHLLS
ncbi:TPA: hypothetical protein ACIIJX_005108, partial [Salmonella enterica subsp. enterica serovar Typhimurium]